MKNKFRLRTSKNLRLDKLLSALKNKNARNSSLDFLYEIVVEKNQALKTELKKIIKKPNEIENTNQFSGLIAEMKDPEFIPPIVHQIKSCAQGEKWLADYLYCLGELLSESDVEIPIDESFIHMIGNLIIDPSIKKDRANVSFYAASVLAHIQHPACEDYFLSTIQNQNDFIMTRIYCLDGLMSHFGIKHLKTIQILSKKEKSPDFKEALSRAIKDLKPTKS